MSGACAMTWVLLFGEMFLSRLTSGFTADSDALAGLLAVVYGHSEAFEGFGEVCRTNPLTTETKSIPDNYLRVN